jgi:hypothetical protein
MEALAGQSENMAKKFVHDNQYLSYRIRKLNIYLLFVLGLVVIGWDSSFFYEYCPTEAEPSSSPL